MIRGVRICKRRQRLCGGIEWWTLSLFGGEIHWREKCETDGKNLLSHSSGMTQLAPNWFRSSNIFNPSPSDTSTLNGVRQNFTIIRYAEIHILLVQNHFSLLCSLNPTTQLPISPHHNIRLGSLQAQKTSNPNSSHQLLHFLSNGVPPPKKTKNSPSNSSTQTLSPLTYPYVP